MAYTDAWDEGVPLGTAAANTLDTIIQNLKRSMRERLEDSFPDWTDDLVDPKRVVVHSDTLANRPDEADANAGEFFLATDSSAIYFFDGTSWVEITRREFYATYDDTLAVSQKMSVSGNAQFAFGFKIEATTAADGAITVDLGEFEDHVSGLLIAHGKVRMYYGFSPTTLYRIDEATISASQFRLFLKDSSGASFSGGTDVVIMAYWLVDQS